MLQLLDIMRSTITGTPILRCDLRALAMQRIGYSAVVDHLLEHVAERVVWTGEMVRCRQNLMQGELEYWLEEMPNQSSSAQDVCTELFLRSVTGNGTGVTLAAKPVVKLQAEVDRFQALTPGERQLLGSRLFCWGLGYSTEVDRSYLRRHRQAY